MTDSINERRAEWYAMVSRINSNLSMYGQATVTSEEIRSILTPIQKASFKEWSQTVDERISGEQSGEQSREPVSCGNCKFNAHSSYIKCAVNPTFSGNHGCESYEFGGKSRSHQNMRDYYQAGVRSFLVDMRRTMEEIEHQSTQPESPGQEIASWGSRSADEVLTALDRVASEMRRSPHERVRRNIRSTTALSKGSLQGLVVEKFLGIDVSHTPDISCGYEFRQRPNTVNLEDVPLVHENDSPHPCIPRGGIPFKFTDGEPRLTRLRDMAGKHSFKMWSTEVRGKYVQEET